MTFFGEKEYTDKIIPRIVPMNKPSGLKVLLTMVTGSQAGPPQTAELRIAALTILAFSNKKTYCEHGHCVPLFPNVISSLGGPPPLSSQQMP